MTISKHKNDGQKGPKANNMIKYTYHLNAKTKQFFTKKKKMSEGQQIPLLKPITLIHGSKTIM